jgi:hypothetical protein
MSFKPWARQTKAGLVCAALSASGLAALYALQLPRWDLAAGFAGLGLVGFVLLHAAYVRWKGKAIEQRSIRGLSWPQGWSANPNVGLPGGGDVDLLVSAPSGDRWAIEIKSAGDVAVKVPWLGLGRPRVVRGNGKAIKEDPIAQARRGAELVGARPVLWYPKGRGKMYRRRTDDLIVVFGSGPKLQRALGIRRWSLF